MKVKIYTLGCRLNFAETEEFVDLFQKNGFEVSSENAKIIIIRGCSVTKKAEKETRQKISEIRKKEINSFIIATGCLKKDFYSLSADLILPKNEEKNLINEVKKIASKKFKENFEIKKLEKEKIKLRTRSFIKIQDGCQRYCSYCLIPYLRGEERSISFKEIIKKIQEKERLGYKEIILTGVNISRWQEKENNFIWLIKEILKKTNISRIRISSLWPNSINEDLLKILKNPRVCQHLHLSLQSLSNSVLKRMGRNYKVEEIKEKIKKIKKFFPDLTLTADIIVGFPNESEEEFKETMNNLKEIGLAKIHVFRYSSREGTKASLFEGQIDEKTKKKRAKILLELSEKLQREWQKKFLGQIKEVLFEEKKENLWQGLTDNYLKVFVESKKDLANQIVPVKLEKLFKDGIIGSII